MECDLLCYSNAIQNGKVLKYHIRNCLPISGTGDAAGFEFYSRRWVGLEQLELPCEALVSEVHTSVIFILYHNYNLLIVRELVQLY